MSPTMMKSKMESHGSVEPHMKSKDNIFLAIKDMFMDYFLKMSMEGALLVSLQNASINVMRKELIIHWYLFHNHIG